MSNNNYSEDHQFGTEEYKPLLDNYFYPFITKGGKIRRFDGENPHDLLRQTKLKMDLEIELLPSVWFDNEEKIVRWPVKTGRPHTAFYYETESCSLPGRITPGWIKDSEAQCLLYAFEIFGRGLDIYFTKEFQAIKKRFWLEMDNNPNRNFFEWSRNPAQNQSQGRKVPIGFIVRNFPQTERYHLHLDGACERVDFSATLLPYKREGAA